MLNREDRAKDQLLSKFKPPTAELAPKLEEVEPLPPPLEDDDDLLIASSESPLKKVENFDDFLLSNRKESLQRALKSVLPSSISPDQAISTALLSPNRSTLSWIASFRPRKPHFFNKVKQGYEWTGLNLARYDVNNPPPKAVLGYRFNIFFPEKVDLNPPSYHVRVLEDPQYAVIEFNGGPPYEKIAFKVLNGKWDMADRKTFRCVFDSGIFQLYYDFVRVRYKR